MIDILTPDSLAYDAMICQPPVERTQPAASAIHPLQRQWDELMLQSWKANGTISGLRQDFTKLTGTKPVKATGLLRLPMDDEPGTMPMQSWMATTDMKPLMVMLHKNGYMLTSKPIPQTFIDKVTQSKKLDCTKRATFRHKL